jgi:peptidoglycan/xylan/chitin deacetylase (PgdA/CDA1 family)
MFMRNLLLRLLAALAVLLPWQAANAQTTVTIPVLCYHGVNDNPSGRYQLSAAKFQEQMVYLKNNGFTPLSIDDYYRVMTGQIAAPAKPILLTFDDSFADFATHVVPVLQQHGFKATQFVVSGWVNTANHLSSSQIASLSATYDMQNHTDSHTRLTSLSYAGAFGEIVRASDRIQAWAGKRPEFLAYPYGATDANAQQAARDNGIKMAFTVSGQKSTSAMNFLALPRYTIVSSETLSSFAKKVN